MAIFLEIPLEQVSQQLFVSGIPSDFIRHDAALFCAPVCKFRAIDPFARAPLIFGETFDPSGAPSPDPVKSDPLRSPILKPYSNMSEPKNFAIEAMTTSALKPCSNIPELLKLATEVSFITRQMLLGHRAYLASHHKSNAAVEGAIRLFGLKILAAGRVFTVSRRANRARKLARHLAAGRA